MSIQQEKFKAIANKIREKTGTTEAIKPNNFVDKIEDVYQAGKQSQQGVIDNLNNELEQIGKRYMVYASEILETEEEINKFGVEVQFIENEDIPFEYSNLSDAIPDVFDAGKKYEFDRFWDSFQQNGNRVNYENAFGGIGWTDDLFKPQYDMKPTNAYMMFRGSSISSIAELPVKLDFADTTNFQYMFQWSQVQHVGVVDTRKATPSGLTYTFAYCPYLTEIDKLIFKDDGTQTMNSNMFTETTTLKDIDIEGVIGTNGFNVQWCKNLTHKSLISIINALSSNTSGLTITLSKKAVNDAFGIDVDDVTTYPEGSEFYNLRNSKSNWNFSYV